MPAVMDHYRADAADPLDRGVYRVVGTDDDAVVLLRVAEDGRRVHGGHVVRLPREDLAALAPAADPDTGLGRLRQAPGTLADRPLFAATGLLMLGVGGYRASTAGGTSGLFLAAGGLAILWLVLR